MKMSFCHVEFEALGDVQRQVSCRESQVVGNSRQEGEPEGRCDRNTVSLVSPTWGWGFLRKCSGEYFQDEAGTHEQGQGGLNLRIFKSLRGQPWKREQRRSVGPQGQSQDRWLKASGTQTLTMKNGLLEAKQQRGKGLLWE